MLPLELLPDLTLASRAYLGLVPQITAQVPLGRIYRYHLPAQVILPALRVADLSTSQDGRGWVRSLLQVDVFHSTGRLPDAKALADLVVAALEASTGHVLEDPPVVLGGVDPITGATAQPYGDGTDPTVPGSTESEPASRYLVQAGIVARPN